MRQVQKLNFEKVQGYPADQSLRLGQKVAGEWVLGRVGLLLGSRVEQCWVLGSAVEGTLNPKESNIYLHYVLPGYGPIGGAVVVAVEEHSIQVNELITEGLSMVNNVSLSLAMVPSGFLCPSENVFWVREKDAAIEYLGGNEVGVHREASDRTADAGVCQ